MNIIKGLFLLFVIAWVATSISNYNSTPSKNATTSIEDKIKAVCTTDVVATLEALQNFGDFKIIKNKREVRVAGNWQLKYDIDSKKQISKLISYCYFDAGGYSIIHNLTGKEIGSYGVWSGYKTV